MIRLYALLFAFSGATGLIYESVWSHYLKLILGHAAFAQTLVMAIFMGGMALGAWSVSRLSRRLPDLLLAYAAVEGLIGVFGLLFQGGFEWVSSRLFDHWLPGLSPDLGQVLKLGVATLLILPQSVLLGATFPLMCGGILRLGGAQGRTVALLYFSNSLGAVVGVLGSGFWLISRVGLPGALLTAGMLNFALALFVYLANRRLPPAEPLPEAGMGARERRSPVAVWVLGVAALTGAASFCYEIAWIRMLSMVLGSSTHSFELMLAAFILGLALGGLWIHRRIDGITHPRTFLGIVQILMGAFALLTLPLYDLTFDWMAWAISGLARTEPGYVLFSAVSHGIALLVMLPATFCAGMTLPLLTTLLLRDGGGERSVGQVYAANTLGSIVGIAIAVHGLIPAVGLKGLMLSGALIDGALGAYLLLAGVHGATWVLRAAWAGGFGLLWSWLLVAAELDPQRMASGVYRYARSFVEREASILAWRDGKTASIGAVRSPSGLVTISTNGKPDAGLNLGTLAYPADDEYTMTLLGTLPALYAGDLKRVANIGFGSGMTSHVLLGFPQVARLDTIEIEPEMVNVARSVFAERLPRAFNDPRSVVFVADARTHFSSHGEPYDVIVSEPSNPWVSGVSSLFSVEFYRHVARHLKPDGVFVQWLQLYETSPRIVASVLGAMDEVFSDYHVYSSNNSDALIVARIGGALREPDFTRLDSGAGWADLRYVGIEHASDIRRRLVGSKRTWSPMFAAFRAPVNSDYFPFVDLHAARYRFAPDVQTLSLLLLGDAPSLALESVALIPAPEAGKQIAARAGTISSWRIRHAQQTRDALRRDQEDVPASLSAAFSVLRDGTRCDARLPMLQTALFDLASATLPYLPSGEMEELWSALRRAAPCLASRQELASWWDLYRALGQRDWPRTVVAARGLMTRDGLRGVAAPQREFVLQSLLFALLASGDPAGFSAAVSEFLLPAVGADGALPGGYVTRLALAEAYARGWHRAGSELPAR